MSTSNSYSWSRYAAVFWIIISLLTLSVDFKSTMVLYDLSTEDGAGIDLSIFRPEKEIPAVSAADVIVLYNVKVQRWRSDPISLITHFSTCILVYSASKIPRPPQSASIAMLPPPARKAKNKDPTENENRYVSYMFHTISKDAIPDQEEFAAKSTASLNLKEKFSLLQDVHDSKFYDLIVQVAREPYDLGDKVTLYVSDYTENDGFFNYTWDGVKDLETRGDVWGYTSKDKENGNPKDDEWVGPYGKKAMQITVFDPHADYARNELHAGDWISIRNVYIKTGNNGMHLEGFVREARNQTASTNHMVILDTHDRDSIDPKLKDAIRRCRDYNKEKKADIKRLKTAEDGGGEKRKRVDSESEEPTNPNKTTKLNAKQRRKLHRQSVDKKVAEEEAQAKAQEAKALEDLDLNSAIVCEHPDKPVTTLSTMVEHHPFETTVDGEKTSIPLPFVCNNYRANVRVVDFRPNRLEDFASSRRRTQFDVLSDNSGEESSSDSDASHHNGRKKVWEWRFALCLEDATKTPGPKTRLWVLIDNLEGQYLTGLDASDLRHDIDNLTTLREKMFCLWGELEEHKHGVLALRKRARPGGVPPPTLSDDEREGEMDVSNTAFTCCVRQYGVQVKESDKDRADAGKGKRWERVFGMFGTKIAS